MTRQLLTAAAITTALFALPVLSLWMLTPVAILWTICRRIES